MEIAIIFVGLILLIVLVFKGISIYIATPLCAILVAILSGVDFFQAYMTTYMDGMVGFAKTYLPMFMLGAIFGKVMEDSGASKSIALFIVNKLGKGKALLSIVLAGAILTYGGVSIFVASFALYPLALAIFREANISRRLIPATIQAGTFTFTMVALPGSPAIQNIIPTNYFGTTAMAAPVLGIIAAVIMFVLSMLWLDHAKIYQRSQGKSRSLSSNVSTGQRSSRGPTNMRSESIWGISSASCWTMTLNASSISAPSRMNFRNTEKPISSAAG